MFDFFLKGKNFDVEILKLLKQKIFIKIETEKLLKKETTEVKVSLHYQDDAGTVHLITESKVEVGI
jgi:ribosomal protein S8